MRYAWSMYEVNGCFIVVWLPIRFMCRICVCMNGACIVCALNEDTCVLCVCIWLNVSMRFEFGTRFTLLQLSLLSPGFLCCCWCFFSATMLKSKRVDCGTRITLYGLSMHHTRLLFDLHKIALILASLAHVDLIVKRIRNNNKSVVRTNNAKYDIKLSDSMKMQRCL